MTTKIALTTTTMHTYIFVSMLKLSCTGTVTGSGRGASPIDVAEQTIDAIGLRATLTPASAFAFWRSYRSFISTLISIFFVFDFYTVEVFSLSFFSSSASGFSCFVSISLFIFSPSVCLTSG